MLAAVVDQGGFGPAAATLNRSQSAVSYAVARLQESLDVPLLIIEGRKAVLTPHGQTLLRRARTLLRDIDILEGLARSLKQGWEPELRLVVDFAFPRERLLGILAELQRLYPATQLQLSDAVLSGADEAIVDGSADVVVQIDRALTTDDLTRHVQVVIRDSGTKQPRDEGWLGADQRCMVSSMEAALATVQAGLAYAWLPEHLVQDALRRRAFRPLPLILGGTRNVGLHLVLVQPELAGPAARAAVECFQRHVPATPAMLDPMSSAPLA